MKLNHPMCNKRSLSTALLTAAVVAFILTLIKITSYLEASARAQNLVKRAAAKEAPIPRNSEQIAAESWAVAEQLKKNNLFSPPIPPRHPVTSVLGILGNEALIGDRWYKAGDSIADAKVVAVEPTQVRVQWQGRETVFVPMQTEGQSAPSGSWSMSQNFAPSGGISSPASTSAPSKMPARAMVVRSSRSDSRAVLQNKAGLSAETSKKLQSSADKPLQKILKQDAKSSVDGAAARKGAGAASAGRKAASANMKKLTRP